MSVAPDVHSTPATQASGTGDLTAWTGPDPFPVAAGCSRESAGCSFPGVLPFRSCLRRRACYRFCWYRHRARLAEPSRCTNSCGRIASRPVGGFVASVRWRSSSSWQRPSTWSGATLAGYREVVDLRRLYLTMFANHGPLLPPLPHSGMCVYAAPVPQRAMSGIPGATQVRPSCTLEWRWPCFRFSWSHLPRASDC